MKMKCARGVVLVGPMAAGKSSVGRRLASELGLPFVDLDREIERLAGRSIPEIFASEGESVFREWEHTALTHLVEEGAPLVLATGGGVVLLAENWPLLRRLGIVVWLDVPPEVAWERAQREGGGVRRPLLDVADPLARLRELDRERRSRYAQADLRIDARADLEEVVAAIKQALNAPLPGER